MNQNIMEIDDKSAYDPDFIENVIIPMLTGLVQKKLFSAAYDLDGKIIIATDMFAGYFGYSSMNQIQGKSLHDILAEIGKLEQLNLIDHLNKIRLKVINTGSIVTHLNLIPFQNKILTTLVYNIPIFRTDGKVVATRTIARKIDLISSVAAMNNNLIHGEPICKVKPWELHLSPRQNEILYLLTIGFSQNQVADYLGITRGTISKIISETICPLFEIDGSNTKLLVKTIIASKYFERASNPFLEPRIIEIDSNIELYI
ncbi:MAG: hypothetical protein K2X04_06080 [Burkholderiales bacterium]|nr:hypothetical protein [Burkholderiales bacterium]